MQSLLLGRESLRDEVVLLTRGDRLPVVFIRHTSCVLKIREEESSQALAQAIVGGHPVPSSHGDFCVNQGRERTKNKNKFRRKEKKKKSRLDTESVKTHNPEKFGFYFTGFLDLRN